MDTDLLTSFLEVAQRLHFGHAADRLGMTQPALSHQIRRLERQIGAALFARTSRQVTLTAAGAAFVPQARRVLVELERAVAHCRSIAAGGTGHLRIGSIGAALNSVTPGLVRRLYERLPGLAIQLTQLDTPPQLAALRAGELDLGVVRSADPATGVTLFDLFAEPMMLALPAGHRLATKPLLTGADLRDEAFILWPRATNPLFHDQVLGYCQAAGFSPRTAMEGADIETQLGLVSAGIGVSPQPASFSNLARSGVTFKSLRDAPESVVQLAWSRSAPPVRLDDAVAAATETATEVAAVRLSGH
ncbi:LysR substrate-binding domain-containing protein [Rugosimonospora africana]|uniref:LysR family transcriptional regulator n=1 Tax=Rugosimonospora africana TaxID=556532 RepID=A0A8J3R1W5_9ACTN|nr:LysR substrate-binding domain-containing protein [Rugosimonospora africana]GIH19865.1 LysR family transcriptional regulator [Rugosimonospora africana]